VPFGGRLRGLLVGVRTDIAFNTSRHRCVKRSEVFRHFGVSGRNPHTERPSSDGHVAKAMIRPRKRDRQTSAGEHGLRTVDIACLLLVGLDAQLALCEWSLVRAICVVAV
jgi:hypothetical protein